MISIGLFILLVPPAAEIGFLWMLLGFLLICGAWYENSILIIRTAGGYLRDVLTSVVKYADQAAKLLKAKFFALIEFGRVHFKAIAKTVTTLVGVLLVLFGLLGSFELLYVTGVPPSILILAGTIILYTTWLSQVNEVLIRIARSIYGVFVAFSHYLWDTGVSIKDAVVSFFDYVLNYWKEILRAITTILSVLLISNGVFLGNLLFLVAGIVILYVTWFSQVNEFLNVTARSIYAALIAFGHYLWDVGVEIKDAVASFFTYVISLWKEILRAGATIIGIFLILIGISQLDLFPLGAGIVILYVVWFSQVNDFLNRTARSIYTALIAL